MTFAERVRLPLLTVRQTLALDQGVMRRIPLERLYVLFRLCDSPTVRDGLVDTGSFMTVLPEACWKRHEHEIQWIAPAAVQPLPAWLTRVTGMTGGDIDCRVGAISLQFADSERRDLRPRRILVKCARDDGRLSRALIGLGGGVLEDLRLELEISSRVAWLRERPASG